MKQIRRLVSLLVVVFTVAWFTMAVAFAAGIVNWEENLITATGTGIPPQNAMSPAQARLLARRAAVVDGYRMLAESVKGVNVDAETTVENLVVRNDTVRAKVSACIKGAMITSEREIPGGYEVTMQLPMFGDSNPLAAAVIPRPAYQEPFPEPDESEEPSAPVSTVTVKVNINEQTATMNPYTYDSKLVTANTRLMVNTSRFQSLSAASTDLEKNLNVGSVKKKESIAATLIEEEHVSENVFTGLVVDCRGLGLNSAMSPVIKNKKGEPIYGHKNLDYDMVISKGMVSYTSDINSFERAGSKPLIVKAISLENFNGNPVISVGDANRVLIENRKSGFLDKMNVVFVK